MSIPSIAKESLPQGSYLGKISVKLYSELSAAALKTKLDKWLALWYELRCLTSSGRLPFNDVLAALVPGCYSKATLYRLLRSGDGVFWHIWQADKLHPEVRVEYFGLYKVARLLGVDYLSRPREVPLSLFIGRKGKRAQLYSSFHKPAGFGKAKPISRDSLKDITGVSRRSQIRYDKVAGNRRVANFAFQDDGKGGSYPMLEFRPGKSSEYLTVRRLGNIYHSKAMIAPRGMVKRVNGQLRQGSLKRDEGSMLQRFFLSAKSLLKCHNKDPEPFLLVSSRDRLIKGRLEWCLA
ncbi:hypothetical protein ES703_73555 [subsurface metagenome]